MREIYIRVITKPEKPVARRDVVELIKSKSRLTKSTPYRRAQMIFKWFE